METLFIKGNVVDYIINLRQVQKMECGDEETVIVWKNGHTEVIPVGRIVVGWAYKALLNE